MSDSNPKDRKRRYRRRQKPTVNPDDVIVTFVPDRRQEETLPVSITGEGPASIDHKWPRGKRNGFPGQKNPNRGRSNQYGKDSHQQGKPKRKRKEKKHYKEYLSQKELQEGVADGSFVLGDFRVNAHRRSEAYATVEGEPRDIMFNSRTRQNRAYHGDVVVLSILPGKDEEQKEKKEKKEKKEEETEEDESESESEGEKIQTLDEAAAKEADLPRRKQGIVVGIHETNHQTQFVGHLQSTRESGMKLTEADSYAFFVPTNKNAPRALVQLQGRVKKLLGPRPAVPRSKDEMENILNEGVFVSEYIPWTCTMRDPRANLREFLGMAGEKDTEFTALNTGNNIEHTAEFDEKCLKGLPGADYQIPAEEMAKRKDLRGVRIFSIDPPTAKDLDDALHCTRLPNGNFEIGVHIADVSHFVTPGSELDKEAARRATTVYFVTHNIPMLPRVLCDNLCSLVVGVDRLSFSVIWTISPDAKVLSKWFGKTVMRSRAQLDYGTAQEMVDNPDKYTSGSDKELMACAEDIMEMQKLADIMRKRRFLNGSLSLDSVKLSFDLDENENPIGVHEYERHGSHFLVEEFMLLANISVAERIFESFPDNSLLRRHEAPHKAKMDAFVEDCRKFGFDLETHSSLAIHKSLQRIVKTADPSISATLLWLGTKPMQTAKYTQTERRLGSEHYHHFALNFPFYTHFTSPIRRYADLMVHRVLQAAIQETEAPYPSGFIARICQNCNDRKSDSDRAQDQCDLLYLSLLLKKVKKLDTVGIIAEKGDKTMTIYCPKYGVDKRVYFEDLGCSKAKKDGDVTELVWWKEEPEVEKKEEAPEAVEKDGKGGKKKKKAKGKKEPEKEVVKSVPLKVGDMLEVTLIPDMGRKLNIGIEVKL